MVKFLDSENMVFRFGEMELRPTIEEILISYESVAMCNKRKRHPDTDLLNPIMGFRQNYRKEGKITAMDKGKNTRMELTEEELQRKIKRVTWEIQEAREEGLSVDMATAIYKAATVTLDKDMSSQMKRKKDVEMETEGLREKLEMLRLKVQEREAIEARIDSKIAALLAKSVSLDKELTEETEEFATMREGVAALKKKDKAFHSNL
ncbi:uncharacterized protein [Solanum lycopersicum]|uniref:uncharacterized protein n=1 Tax=Solanum lycopersicum TaxID=4081 RepID=UPI003749C485